MKKNLILIVLICCLFTTFGCDDDFALSKDMANLSARVYDDFYDDILDAVAPWIMPDLDFIGNTSHYQGVYTESNGAFYAKVFRNTNTGQYVLVFRGSQPLELQDWIDDFQQLFSDYFEQPDDQYLQAVDLAGRMKARYGSSLLVTGHSLGGGMAMTAALAHDLQAICFDAAGITQYTIDNIAQISSSQLQSRKQNITHINVRFDPLSDFDGQKNDCAPFCIAKQYGAETYWLKCLPGTGLTLNPLRVINHFYQTVVYQLENEEFL